jgi:hypothetical protein
MKMEVGLGSVCRERITLVSADKIRAPTRPCRFVKQSKSACEYNWSDMEIVVVMMRKMG